ncbi:MAG: hypothetical protein PHI62_01145 [Candidatus Methanomethylophilaceae archaeon]|nr:hypothetical protein [Candidatus Methanomethylophilaceae archaeon]
MTSEFSLRYTVPGGAFLSFSVTLFTLILLPLSLFALINGLVANMGTELIGEMTPEQMQQILDELWLYVRKLIRYAIPLLIIAIPMGLYRAGSYAKIPFRFLFAIYSVIIIIGLTDGGMVDIALDLPIDAGSEFSIENIVITLDITVFIYITMLIGTAGAFLAFTEFASNRKDFMEKKAEIDEGPQEGDEETVAVPDA